MGNIKGSKDPQYCSDCTMDWINEKKIHFH